MPRTDADAGPDLAQHLREALEAAGGGGRVAITLGSGLGEALAAWEVIARWPWSDFLPVTGGEVPGHRRELLLAQQGDHHVLLVSGRLHYYQGVAMDVVTGYVNLLADVGVTTLVLTNAAGGLNPEFQVGDLMVIADHINVPGLAGEHPLRGGPNFLDSTSLYSPHLRALAHRAAASAGFVLREGIYAMVGGPSYETPAEQRFLRALGADAVGMSTAPETLVARLRGIDVVGFSSITNVAGAPSVSHTEVLAAGAQVAQRLALLLGLLLPDLDPPRR